MLGDFEVDIISGRKRKDLAGQRVLVAVKPLRGGDESVVFLQQTAMTSPVFTR